MIKVEINAKKVVRDLDSLSSDIHDVVGKETLKAALLASTEIKKRTLSGRDVGGRAFKRYAQSTLKRKQGRGGRFFSGNVDLNDTGKMMAAMQARKTGPLAAKVFFVSKKQRDKAIAHNTGSGRLPKRNFFGLSSKEKKEINTLFKQAIDRILSR